LQIYTTVLKFIKTIHTPPWVTAAARPTAMGHGGKATANGRDLGVGPRQLTVVRHSGIALSAVADGGSHPYIKGSPAAALLFLSGKSFSLINVFN
jgi:hypothetical protein